MYKRPMVVAALLFVSGIFFAAYDVNLIIVATVCAFVCGFTYCRTRKTVASLFLGVFILAGVFRMEMAIGERNSILAQYSGRQVHLSLTVTEFSSDDHVTASFKDRKGTHKVFLTIEDAELSPGDIIEGDFNLYTPFGAKTEFPGNVESFAGRGIYLMGTAREFTVKEEKESGFYGAVYSLRVYMDKLGEKAFSGNNRALFNAMIFGDKRLVSDELYSALQASGLNHIAVVSGMHLSVAMALMVFFAQKIFRKKRRGNIFVLAGAFLLTFITGAGASVVRAFIMCLMYLMAKILYRENDSPTSLAFAVVVMTGVNPYIVFNVGFVLSVLAVAGILLFNGKLKGFFKRFMPQRLAEVLSISISAQLAVIPMVVYCFGTFSTYGLLTNMLLVPLAGIYVISGMVYILLSPVGVVLPLIAPFMKLLSQTIASICFTVKEFKFSLISFSGSMAVFSAVWVFLIIVFYAKPFKGHMRRKLAAGFLVIPLLIYAVPRKTDIEFNVISYGDKNMIAFENPCGDSFLVDCPSICDVRVIENPDNPFTTVVLTGNYADRVLDTENNVQRIIASKYAFSKTARENFEKKAKERNIRVDFIEDFEKFSIGNITLEYVQVGAIKRVRGVKIEYDDKSLITLQGFYESQIRKMEKDGASFHSDYLVLPGWGTEYKESLFSGKIIKQNYK